MPFDREAWNRRRWRSAWSEDERDHRRRIPAIGGSRLGGHERAKLVEVGSERRSLRVL